MCFKCLESLEYNKRVKTHAQEAKEKRREHYQSDLPNLYSDRNSTQQIEKKD